MVVRGIRRTVGAAALAPLLASCFALLSPSPALLGQVRGQGTVPLELFGGFLDPRAPASLAEENNRLGGDAGLMLGARSGYSFPNALFVEAEVAYTPFDMRFGESDGHIDALLYGLSLGYDMHVADRVQVFGVLGGGLAHWFPEGLSKEVKPRFAAGVGLRVFLTRGIGLRVDGRGHLIPDGFADTRRGLNPDAPAGEIGGSIRALEVSAGLAFSFGGGETDTDGDGVPDRLDACPGTPLGARVDERGCPLDSDGDGVPDFRDRCPDTPRGAAVDETGCPLDSDGDGVPDGLDRCPDTPRGLLVGPDGCPLGALEEELVRDGRAVLEGVSFREGADDLLPASFQALRELGRVLARHPALRVEIRAHTDAVGDAEENRALTERRAEAVRAFLLREFLDLDPDRIAVRGFGSSQPVASNQTEEGRARNRRVEVVRMEGD